MITGSTRQFGISEALEGLGGGFSDREDGRRTNTVETTPCEHSEVLIKEAVVAFLSLNNAPTTASQLVTGCCFGFRTHFYYVFTTILFDPLLTQMKIFFCLRAINKPSKMHSD